MQELIVLYEKLWYKNISTYLNSGNVIFESEIENTLNLKLQIEASIKSHFGFEVQVLVKTKQDMQIIANSIPIDWVNDENQKTDVAYLFPEIDNENTISWLSIKKEFLEIYYIPWAICWNVKRTNYNSSLLVKLANNKIYKLMTVRNVNTARFLWK